jgi:hypothetical protein
MFLRCSDSLRLICAGVVMAVLACAALPAAAREKDTTDYGAGLITNIPLPESEVSQVVSDVAQNGIIRGTKEYNKDEYISGAEAAASSKLFSAWTDGGKVFYKIRKQAIDPRNFKGSNDVGTLAVRYVVQPQGGKNTVLRIDAVFVEEFRHAVHPSNGSVESSEYKVIQEHLDALELMKRQTAEAEQERQQRLAKKNFGMGDAAAPSTVSSDPPNRGEPSALSAARESERDTTPAVAVAAPGETLEEHVANLRRAVERIVKAPGAPMKSAPFHAASVLATLPSGTEVLIVITTPYWLGVETHDGRHGWIPREQLEPLP